MTQPEALPTAALRVAGVAFRSEFGDVEDNLGRMLAWMDRAAELGADLVCFPEVALQGYCTVPEVVHRLAEPAHGSACQRLCRRASQLGLAVSLGMSLRSEDRVHNSQVFLGPDGFLGAQHKVHLCGNDRTYEPGSAWNVVRWRGWNLGATICFDSEFPEAARILALQGAHLVLMSFATGRRNSLNEPARPEDWKRELMAYAPSRAYDNRIFVVGVNHAGAVRDERGWAVANPCGLPGAEEWAPPGTTHLWPGYAFAVNPLGQVFAESPTAHGVENLVLAELDPSSLTKARTAIEVKWPAGTVAGDFLAVRRVDTFGELVRGPEGRTERGGGTSSGNG